MARAKKATKEISIAPKADFLTSFLMGFSEKIIHFKPNRKTYLVLLIVGILLLAFYKKEWFVAATINGVPVTNLELLSRMNQQFRTQTLNQMINEKIILGEAAKKQITVSSAEIDQKLQELEAQVGGPEVFESLLSQQGQSRDSLKEQLRLQLVIEKLYENEATISAQEIDQFLETNSALLTSTDSAKQREEAEEAIKQQKLSQIFSEKFQMLRQSADIKIY